MNINFIRKVLSVRFSCTDANEHQAHHQPLLFSRIVMRAPGAGGAAAKQEEELWSSRAQ